VILIRFGGHPGQAQNVRRSPRAHDDDVFGTAPLRAWLGTTRPAPADPLTTDERTELAQLRREVRQLRFFFPAWRPIWTIVSGWLEPTPSARSEATSTISTIRGDCTRRSAIAVPSHLNSAVALRH